VASWRPIWPYNELVPIRLQVSAEDDPSRPTYRYEFDGDRSAVVLGRRGGVDVLLPHPRVSLVHARIERRGTAYTLIDEGSTHGTSLNGVRLRAGARAALRPGDRISIADFVIEVAVSLTELDGPGDNSRLIARRMVRDVLERLGPREAQPRLEPAGGAPLHLPDLGRTYVLGLGADGNLALDAVDMWREHVALEREEGGVTLRLLGPGGSVRVGGARVEAPVQLRDGDELELGAKSARYFDPAEAYLRRLEVGPEAATAPAVEAAPPRRARAGRATELMLIAAGLLAVLLGGAGLVWVSRW
jgi:pSer/pThr/pTyr-binding forkhead associated (FHA) protein